VDPPLTLISIDCPFNICCHQQLGSSWFDVIRCLSVRQRLFSLAKPSPVTFSHCLLTHDHNFISCQKFPCTRYRSIYWRVFTIYCSPFAHKISLTQTLGQATSRSWSILSYFVFTPLFLLVAIAITIRTISPACLLDFHVGRINRGTFGAVLTSCFSGHSESSIPLPCSISDSMCAWQIFYRVIWIIQVTIPV